MATAMEPQDRGRSFDSFGDQHALEWLECLLCFYEKSALDYEGQTRLSEKRQILILQVERKDRSDAMGHGSWTGYSPEPRPPPDVVFRDGAIPPIGK